MESNIKILAVDDNPSFRQSLQIILSPHGYDVDFAKDVEEGKTKTQTGVYDIILLDLKLPAEREGLELLEFIKKNNSEAVVLMMTGYGDVPTAVKAIKLGAEDFIEKDSEFDNHLLIRLERITQRITLLKDREELIRLLWEQTITETDTLLKGKLLEKLCTSVFKSIAGFEIIYTNGITQDEEIDILIGNNRSEPFWLNQGPLILVECKNWSKNKVGKNEFLIFRQKIANRSGRSKLGFLISTGKFAGTVTTEMVRFSNSEILITPIDRDQLEKLIYSSNRATLLQEYVTKALLI